MEEAGTRLHTAERDVDSDSPVPPAGKGIPLDGAPAAGAPPPASGPATTAAAATGGAAAVRPRPESPGSSDEDLGAAPEPSQSPPQGQQAEDLLLHSPFIDLQHSVTLYEGIKLFLMAPVVVLKLLILAWVVPYAWCVLVLLLLGHKPQTPMHPLRQFLVRQWIHQWGRFLLFVSGFYNIPVRGWHNLKQAEECRAILVFNHPSYVDAAVMGTFFTPSGVSKAGVASIPFIGRFGIALQLFFVERKGSSDIANRHVLKGDAVRAIAQRAADRRFPLLAIAPEATTKSQPCLLKFRRGAFVAGQPVCPVLLRYSYRHFNPGWGVCFTPFHVYRLLAQFVNHLDITILPPYHPSEEERRDWVLYASNVRQLMGRELGLPLVEQGLSEERQLARLGARVNLLGTKAWFPALQPQGREKAE